VRPFTPLLLVAGADSAAAMTGAPDGDTAYQVPPKVLTPSPTT